MKEKTGLKRMTACFMAVILFLTSAPLASLAGIDLSAFDGFFDVRAYSGKEYNNTGIYYEVSNGEVTITDADAAIKIADIPESIDGYPVTSIGDNAFWGCTGLTNIAIPDSVTSIDYRAFYGCAGLTSITIPDSVMSIGERAFKDCTSLISVTIGNSVTSIGSSAFDGCIGLTSITIPDSVTSIDGCAFDDTAWYNSQPNGDVYAGKVYYKYKGKMPRNTSITIKDGTKSITSSAFNYCTGLTSITIPDSVTSIGDYAFHYCSDLTSITIPDSVTSIGDYAFYYCYELTSVTIGNSVTSIGDYAFYYCPRLTSITIPNSVTSIGGSAFSGCYGLTSITIPNSVASIGSGAFSGCTGLESISVDGGNTVYHSQGNCLIKTESKELVSGCKNSVILDDGSVTSIGEDAFYGCTGMKKITIPDSVTSIGDWAFYHCTGLASVTIGNSVTSIGRFAFDDCTGLTSITIPDSVTSIGRDAFEDCTGLTNVTIGNSVTSIGSGAFSGCTSLTSITIPDSVTSIDACAFMGCSGLTSIIIPDSVTSIGELAFKNCTGLTSITIGNGVTSIYDPAFIGCIGLKRINVDDGNTVYHSQGNCLIKTESKKLVLGCKNSVIPDDGSVTSIGSYAFSLCTGLTSITIPNSITSIGYRAFDDCRNLKTVYYGGTQEQWEKISIVYGNSYLKYAKILYNCVSNNSKYITGDVGIKELLFCVREKNTAVDGDIMNIEKLTGEVHPVLKNAKAVAYPSASTFTIEEKDKIKIPYNDGKEGITFSADKYNDYIIPKDVAESFIYKFGILDTYNETIYMTRDKEDGKPYVSSVYAKASESSEAYTNLVDGGSAYSLKREASYDIIVTAGNVKGTATYYIAQDNDPNHTLSNNTGRFSSASLKNFDKSKKIYAWVVADNGGSEQISLKIRIIDVEENAFYKSLKSGKYSFGGEDGIKITFPNDWVLIGGTDLDMSAFKFPAKCTYDPAQGTVRVAVGLAKYNPTADPTKDEKTWSLFKNAMEGISKEAEKWEEGMMDYKVLQALQKCGYPKNELKEIGREKKFAASGNVMLAIEFSIQNGEFVLKEGYGAIEAKIKASMDGQYAAVVYGISGGADGSFGLTASRQVCSNNAPLSWNLKLSLTPNLKIYAGVGIQNVASASAYGLLKLPFNWSFTQKHIDIALSGEIGLEAKLFIFEKNIPLLSGTLGPANFYYGKETKKLHSRAQIFSDKKYDVLPTYDVQSRDYAENTSGWLGEAKATTKPNKIKANSTTASVVTFKNLQTSVYDNSNAKVITCGGTTIATWIEDDANRDEYNRTRLVYSVYDASNDTWSAPKAVCDDGFVDANPYLATDGTDIYVAWQKLCKTFNAENSLTDKDILSAGEIYLAKYDKAADGFVDSVRLTNDSVYDYNPVVTVKDGSPVVYYCTSADSSMSESGGNKITKYANGKTATVKDDLSTVYAIDVCGDEIAYAVDTDGDVETTDDIGTFYGETTFSKFESGAEKSEMNFAFGKLDGKDTLFVSDGSNIYYNDNGEVKAVLEENTTITGQINAVNVGDGLSIFWTQENEVGNEIFTCSYANGKWSGATQSTSRNNKFTNISIATASNGKVIGMCNETERKLDETENYYVDGTSNLVTFTANDYSDMTLLYAGIDESELVPGQTAKIYATVENNGNIEAESFSIKIADKYGTNTVTKITKPLDSGKKSTYEIEYLVPESFAGGNITLTVEADGDVDSKDNSFTYSVDTPNLVISNSSISNSGSLYTIDATVNNTNFTTAYDLTFKAFFDSTDKEPFDSISIGDLSRDQYKNIQFSFAESDIIADENGSRFVYLVVEDENGNDAQLVVSLNETDTVCGHPVTEERAEIPSTCSEKGRTAGVFCIACETYVSGGEEIPTAPHTEEIDAAVPATCTEPGKTEGKHCSVCGAVIVKQEEAPALGHTEVTDAAVPATCTEKGKTEGKHCSVCNEVLVAQKDIPAPGHTESSWITDKDSSCTVGGTKHIECKVCHATLKTEEIPVKAHTYEDVVTAPTCVTDGYTTHICKVCGNSYVDGKVTALGHTEVIEAAVPATCTEKGKTEGKHCSVCGEVLVAQKDVPANGHTEVIDAAVAATCTEKGKTEGKHCSVCGEVLVKQTEIPAKGHTEVTDKAIAATCTKGGKTAGSHCSVCGEVLVAQKATKALGHKNKTTTTAATTSKDGKIVTACTVCKTVSKTTVIYKASSVKLAKTSYTYNGKTQKPKVTVKDSKGKLLTEGKDYTVEYQSGRKNPGKYTVTVTFKGNYSGKKTLTFTIAPKAPTLKASAAKKSAKLNWNKQTGASGYTVYMATSKNGKYKKIATVKGNRNVKLTKTGLTKGKTYYFKVAAYTTSGGKTISGAYSKVKSVRVK